MNEFGNYLFMLRKKKGYTQAELADLLGVTNKAVSKWETGEAFPETAQLIPLADIFGVTADDLLRGKSSMREKPSDCTDKQEKLFSPLQAQEIARKFRPDSWQKKFAVLIVCGMGFIAAGTIALIAGGMLIESEKAVLAFTCLLIACVGMAVNLFMFAGITSQYAFLPVREKQWKSRVRSFIRQMITGMSFCITGVILIILSALFKQGEKTGALLVLMLIFGFTALAVGVFFFVYGGIVWDGFRKKVLRAMQAQLPQKGEEGQTVSEEIEVYAILSQNEESENSLAGRSCSVIMLLATAIFLLLGFLWNLWHPGWVVFPVGGILCGVAEAVFKRKN